MKAWKIRISNIEIRNKFEMPKFKTENKETRNSAGLHFDDHFDRSPDALAEGVKSLLNLT